MIVADVQRLLTFRPTTRLFVALDIKRRIRRLGLSRRRLGTTYVDRRRIKSALDMRGVELFDHLDARATVFGNLVDISTLHQPHADVGMA